MIIGLEILRPSEERNATADELRVPTFLQCYKLDVVEDGHICRLLIFSCGGQFSSRTGIAKDVRNSQRTTVTAPASVSPACHGERVRSSGLLLSDGTRPFGSFVIGIYAATKALAMTSIIALCSVILPDTRLQTTL